MDIFEEHFKTKAQGNPKDLSAMKKKTPQKISLIDHKKAKNLAITLKGKDLFKICTAIES